MTKTTRITNLDHVVAWDEAEQRHVYLENGDLVFKGNEVIHVGPSYVGAADSKSLRAPSPVAGLVTRTSRPLTAPAGGSWSSSGWRRRSPPASCTRRRARARSAFAWRWARR